VGLQSTEFAQFLANLTAASLPGGAPTAATPAAAMPAAFAASAPAPVETVAPSQPMPQPQVSGGGPPTWAVRLRGLPFTAGEQDVLAFFAKHEVVEHISEDRDAVTMIAKTSGKPSGMAVVKMMSRADADEVVKVLNGQYMGSRFIEVYHNHEVDASPTAAPSTQPPPPTTTLPQVGGLGGAIPPGVAAAFAAAAKAGDTGGSGGNVQAAAAAAAAFNIQRQQQQQQWWNQMPGLVPPPSINVPSRPAETPSSEGDIYMPLGAEAEGVGESTWEALFGFLKRDSAEISSEMVPRMPRGAPGGVGVSPSAALPVGLHLSSPAATPDSLTSAGALAATMSLGSGLQGAPSLGGGGAPNQAVL